MAALEVKHLTFTGPSSTDAAFVVSGIGFTPKAMEIWSSGHHSIDTVEVHSQLSHGMATGSAAGEQSTVGTGALNGAITTYRDRETSDCILLRDSTSTATCLAALTAFGSGTATFNFHTVSGNGASVIFHAIFFAGDDMSVELAEASIGADTLTGLAFQPEFVIMHSNCAQGESLFGNRQLTVGYFNDGIEDVHHVFWGGEGGGGNYNLKETIIRSDGAGSELFGGTTWLLTPTVINSDGFDWNALGTSDTGDFLCFNLSGRKTSVGKFVKPTGTAPQTHTLAPTGFTKCLCLALVTGDKDTESIEGASSFGTSLGMGFSDGTTQTHSYTTDENGTGVTNRDRQDSDTTILACGELDGVRDFEVDASNLGTASVGPELVFDPNTSKATIIGFWAWEDTDVGVAADEVFVMSMF